MGAIDAVKRTQPVNYQTTSEPVNRLKRDVGTAENSPVEFRTRAYERDFAARYTAARLHFGRDPQPPAPTPTPSTPSVTSSGSGTETTYRTGAPTRPNIRHDNGFLQNPNDRTDPNPIPTTAPTESDLEFYESEKFKTAGAPILEKLPIPFWDKDNLAREIPNGIDHYRHFLVGDGADRNFSYDEFVSEDPHGQRTLDNAIADTQRGAEEIYSRMVAENPSLANQSVTFDVTSGAIGVGSTEKNAPFPYPHTENWQKAIGGHSIWNSATVTVTPPTEAGGRPQFSMDYTLHAEDRYNFNPDQADIATGEPDAVRGLQLERTGLAHQYMQYGTAERDVTWTQGDISTTTATTGRMKDVRFAGCGLLKSKRMNDKPNLPLALILLMIAGSAAACGSSENRAVANAAVNNQPNAARNMNESTVKNVEVKTDLESLEKQINLPVRPSEVKWATDNLDNSKGDFPAPSDRRLTALLKYDEKSAAELTQKLSGAPMDASLGKAEIKSWFPDEVKNAARTVDGRTYLEGAKYPPDAFLRSPYLNGNLVRVGNTGYFVLDLRSF